MPEKILVAVDINDVKDAKRVADKAHKLAEAEGAELHVLNVVPDSGMAIVDSFLGPKHAEEMMETARKNLADFVAKTMPDITVKQVHSVHGTIYDLIIRIADDLGASTIVVGAHRPELRDYLVGPNAARVVRHAKQSVFVVRGS